MSRVTNKKRWLTEDPYLNPAPKECFKCLQTKNRSQFTVKRIEDDGLRSWCKECSSAQAKLQYDEYMKSDNYVARKREGNKKSRVKIAASWVGASPYDGTLKICTKCRNTKPKTDFQLNISLTDGLSTQCKECIAVQRIKYKKNNTPQYLYSAAKARAKNLGIPFNLEVSDIVVPKTCPILGFEIGLNRGNFKENSVSLDRVDNSLGYIKGNVCVISKKANTMKADLTIEVMEKLLNYMKSYPKF